MKKYLSLVVLGSVAIMAGDATAKFSVREEVDQLREDGTPRVHQPLSTSSMIEG